jgi:hypothetical protein
MGRGRGSRRDGTVRGSAHTDDNHCNGSSVAGGASTNAAGARSRAAAAGSCSAPGAFAVALSQSGTGAGSEP